MIITKNQPFDSSEIERLSEYFFKAVLWNILWCLLAPFQTIFSGLLRSLSEVRHRQLKDSWLKPNVGQQICRLSQWQSIFEKSQPKWTLTRVRIFQKQQLRSILCTEFYCKTTVYTIPKRQRSNSSTTVQINNGAYWYIISCVVECRIWQNLAFSWLPLVLF